MTRRVVITADTQDEAEDAVAAMNIATRAVRDLYGDKFTEDDRLLTSASTDAEKLRWLAGWLDRLDNAINQYTEQRPADGMQRTLREVADRL